MSTDKNVKGDLNRIVRNKWQNEIQDIDRHARISTNHKTYVSEQPSGFTAPLIEYAALYSFYEIGEPKRHRGIIPKADSPPWPKEEAHSMAVDVPAQRWMFATLKAS